MRYLVIGLMFVGTAACKGKDDTGTTQAIVNTGPGTLAEADFIEQYAKLICKAYRRCDADLDCEPDPWGDRCQYNAIKAEQCLEGEYTCEVYDEGMKWVLPPYECSEVYSYCP